MAFYSIEPWGEFRDELRNGSLMALIANIKRDPEARREPFAAADFMHFIERPEQAPHIDTGDPEQNARLIEAQIRACMRKG
jgi:hypothetical protein